MKKEYIIYKLSDASKEACKIDNELFPMYNVKRGLRNEDGTGVLVGLTKVGNVVGYERLPEGGLKAIPGKLFYRGYDVEDIAHGLIKEKRFGFEEVAYLLLSGKLPDKEELAGFKELICDNMPLEQKTKMNILDLEGQNIMNILARSVLEMYTFDPNPDDTSRDNLMRQSIELISRFPTIIAYAYNIYRHSQQGRSLHIRHPHENLSIAENFLHMLKKDFTDLEARTLDLLLVLQAEHGGGNNSTFTVRVTSSTRTDTYSSIAAGIGFDNCARLLRNRYETNLHIPAEKGERVLISEVFALSQKGDPLCVALVENASEALANLIMNLVRVTDPDTVVLGGGIVSDGYIHEKILEKLHPTTMRFVTNGVVITKLNPGFIGLLGAGAVAMNM